MRLWFASGFCVAFMSSAWAGDGAALFAQNCALCHQSSGAGLPGQFPRLAGRVGAISTHDLGRSYLIDVLTYGLSGTVTVDDQEIIGVMPAFNALPDDVVADILSYVQTLGDRPAKPSKSFSKQEVASERAKQAKSPDEMQGERQELKRAKVIP
ncbi:MAG TPA: cytochrome c [Steroidobacteraceae bacterium]|jgi:mono/diheme cytochrome c family protein